MSRTVFEEEASTDESAHSTQERFPGMAISDELLQMIEKVAKVRTITKARVQRIPGCLTR